MSEPNRDQERARYLMEKIRTQPPDEALRSVERVIRRVREDAEDAPLEDPVFLVALEVAARTWLEKVDELAIYERGDMETATLVNVLKRWIERRRGG